MSKKGIMLLNLWQLYPKLEEINPPFKATLGGRSCIIAHAKYMQKKLIKK